MAVRQQFDTALSAAVTNGICLAQTPAGAGNMLINGSLATGGVATLDTTAAQNNTRQVIITPAADESSHTFTITGRLSPNGALVTEAVAGGNATATTSVAYFYTVTQIAISAAATGSIQIGTNGVGASPWHAVDRKIDPTNITVTSVLKSGAANWTLQNTAYDIFDGTVTPIAFDDATMTAKAANFQSTVIFPTMALRQKINSGSGTVTTIISQADRVG